MKFQVGDRVVKPVGYHYPGVVVAAFYTTDGKERFVVEAISEDYGGMLHIFNGEQLEKV